MNNTLLIISREYLTRVKKKSFIILTLVVPIFFCRPDGGAGAVGDQRS
jgi:ABC-type Na+ efflux pump permease subunit